MEVKKKCWKLKIRLPDLKRIKKFYCVNIEKSGYKLVFWGGGGVVLDGGGQEAKIGVGNKMPVSGPNTAPQSPRRPTPKPRRNSLFFTHNGVATY